MGLQLLAPVSNFWLLCLCSIAHVSHPFSAGPDDGVDSECSDLTVPHVLEGNIFDHLGPYHGGLDHGIFLGTIFCTP